jgi:hypothetical protein
MEADVHGKNITQALDMSGTISSSPGALSSSFIQQERKPQRAATVVDTSRAMARISKLLQFGGTEAVGKLGGRSLAVHERDTPAKPPRGDSYGTSSL